MKKENGYCKEVNPPKLKKVQYIELALKPSAVKKLENLLEDDTLRSFLEREINENLEVFIETMGLDNY